eukprot:9455-Heterococcus_DN1.PRE.2
MLPRQFRAYARKLHSAYSIELSKYAFSAMLCQYQHSSNCTRNLVAQYHYSATVAAACCPGYCTLYQ